MPLPINSSNQGDSTRSFFSTLVANAVGGGMGGFICFPSEGMKKRVQSGALSKSDFYPPGLLNGKVWRALHPAELFRGSLPFGSAVMVASTASMTFNTFMKAHPWYDSSSQKWNASLAIGSGILGAIVGSTPVENIILVQQLQKKNPFQAIHYMWQQNVTRPWVGIRELMLREAGFAGVMLFAGPEVNRIILNKTGDKNFAFVAQIAVGVVGAFATHPADCVATYRQKLDGRVSLKDSVQKMYAKDGINAFFKGAIFRSFLFAACSLIIPRFSAIVHRAIEDE